MIQLLIVDRVVVAVALTSSKGGGVKLPQVVSGHIMAQITVLLLVRCNRKPVSFHSESNYYLPYVLIQTKSGSANKLKTHS